MSPKTDLKIISEIVPKIVPNIVPKTYFEERCLGGKSCGTKDSELFDSFVPEIVSEIVTEIVQKNCPKNCPQKVPSKLTLKISWWQKVRY